MNERIKLLALQAGYTKDMFGVGHWDMPECQKFAELIVLECASIAHNTAEGQPTYGWMVGNKIKDTFWS